MLVPPRIRHIIRKSVLEIVPHVYQLSFRGANVILLVEEELTLIDTGFPGSSSQIVRFIQSLGRSVEEVGLIIITHNHLDHTGGLTELRKLTKAKVAAHKADIDDAENQSANFKTKQGLTRILPFIHSVFSVRLNDVDTQLTGGEVLKSLGGLEVIHTPGHTPGSISLFSAQNRLLIVGDALNKRHWLPPRMVSTDGQQAIDSIRRMAELDFDILCYGHGRPLVRDARARMQRWLEKLKD